MAVVLHRLDEQPRMRRRIDRFLETEKISRATRHVAMLVASELFTNAIEHGDAAEVRVAVEVRDEIVLMVSHPSTRPTPVPSAATMPPPTSERGRGLAIVNLLASDVRTELTGGWHRTTAVVQVSG